MKRWYDGFRFGNEEGIYNPWSIINFLDKRQVGPYWTNTSSNTLIGNVIRRGTRQIKETFEKLLADETITTEVEEQIIYNRLDLDENAVWSLMLASGYLKVDHLETQEMSGQWKQLYGLRITNFEVRVMLRSMVKDWFASSASNYNDFIRALLQDDLDAMNIYMNRITLATFSYFDSGVSSGAEEPERFYHGFVLGLIVSLEDRYRITSNRESGFGRYDILMEPKNRTEPAVLMEFKIQTSREKSLSETADAALRQIEKKNYAAELTARGFTREQIHIYGFAFRGKEVLIKGGSRTGD